MLHKNLVLQFVRVTEAGALGAAQIRGLGDKFEVDKAAYINMKKVLETSISENRIVGSEGEKDKSDTFSYGTILGNPVLDKLDLVVDPVDGTRMTADYDDSGAMAVICASERGNLMRIPTDRIYTLKIAVGPNAKNAIDLNLPLEKNVKNIASALDKDIDQLLACMLKRARHNEFLKKLRNLGVRVKLIQDGDISGAIATCTPDAPIDFYFGSGGPPEGVIAATAVKSMGGDMQLKWAPEMVNPENLNPAERQLKIKKSYALAESLGIDHEKIYSLEEIAKGHVMFAATGITRGDLLKGVRFTRDGARTHSVAMRSQTMTIRFIEAIHKFHKSPIY
ncbi:class II fructose-bisphosphatase [[Eubacterium] cellulosolvens]